jgi:type IV secretory pathway VirB10-like protein
MATMTVTSQSTDTTAYGSRLATLEVAGISLRNGHQTMTVPLNRLSQIMQQIHRQGGKIVSVNTTAVAPVVPQAPMAKAAAPAPQNPEPEQELAMEEPKAAQQSNSKKKRR